MSLPLIDLRAKITAEAKAVLEAVHRETGKDHSEIVREVLSDWADRKIHAAIVLQQTLQREGIAGLDRRNARQGGAGGLQMRDGAA